MPSGADGNTTHTKFVTIEGTVRLLNILVLLSMRNFIVAAAMCIMM